MDNMDGKLYGNKLMPAMSMWTVQAVEQSD